MHLPAGTVIVFRVRRPKTRKPAAKAKPASRARQQAAAGSVGDEGTRERMVAGAARLLAQRGLQATSFSEILELTSAPRGSVYHHFPEGKDQLVAAALELVTAQMGKAFAPEPGTSPEAIVTLFLGLWRGILRHFNFAAGCAVVAVTVATDSPALLGQVGTVFRGWRGRVATLLEQGGVAPTEAARFGATLIAASEGAVVLSRAEQSLEPFELVAAQLLDQARALRIAKRR